MSRSKKLATLFAGVLAMAPLLGTSAFAETRHRDATAEGRGSWRQNRQDQGSNRQQPPRQSNDRGRRNDQSRGNRNDGAYQNRGTYRNNGGYQNRGTYRNNGSYQNYGTYRNNNADRGYRNDNAYRNNESYRGYRNDNAYRGGDRYNRGERHEFRGSVDRIQRWNDGYRVWVGGGAYPIFIPQARWRLGPLQIGASIVLGGYWNPLGYYDAYDYSGHYYSTAGDLHGIVETVDYRRGTAVIRDDVSGSFVTIELRGSDPRLGYLQPGQYVDLSGAWDRAGFFEAYSVLNIGGQYGGYGD